MDPLHVYALFEVLNGRIDPAPESPRPSLRSRAVADQAGRRRRRVWPGKSRAREHLQKPIQV